jgi:hypothetical protein
MKAPDITRYHAIVYRILIPQALSCSMIKPKSRANFREMMIFKKWSLPHGRGETFLKFLILFIIMRNHRLADHSRTLWSRRSLAWLRIAAAALQLLRRPASRYYMERMSGATKLAQLIKGTALLLLLVGLWPSLSYAQNPATPQGAPCFQNGAEQRPGSVYKYCGQASPQGCAVYNCKLCLPNGTWSNVYECGKTVPKQ